MAKQGRSAPGNEISRENPVPDKITDFVKRHHVMTVATVSACGEPWCANLFYSYIPEENIFVFTTGPETRHGTEIAACSIVAASIVLETKNVGKIQGLQMQGQAQLADGDILEKAKRSYLKKFPYAVLADLTLWVLSPAMFKLTDNRLGFGKKLYWYENVGDE